MVVVLKNSDYCNKCHYKLLKEQNAQSCHERTPLSIRQWCTTSTEIAFCYKRAATKELTYPNRYNHRLFSLPWLLPLLCLLSSPLTTSVNEIRDIAYGITLELITSRWFFHQSAILSTEDEKEWRWKMMADCTRKQWSWLLSSFFFLIVWRLATAVFCLASLNQIRF